MLLLFSAFFLPQLHYLLGLVLLLLLQQHFPCHCLLFSLHTASSSLRLPAHQPATPPPHPSSLHCFTLTKTSPSPGLCLARLPNDGGSVFLFFFFPFCLPCHCRSRGHCRRVMFVFSKCLVGFVRHGKSRHCCVCYCSLLAVSHVFSVFAFVFHLYFCPFPQTFFIVCVWVASVPSHLSVLR